MAEYKEPKFVKWIMEGDKRSCDRLIGTAQQFLNTIRGINKGGFNVPIIRRTLADGSEITAKTHLPGVDIITIKAQVGGGKRVENVGGHVVGHYSGMYARYGSFSPMDTYFWGVELQSKEVYITYVAQFRDSNVQTMFRMDMNDNGFVVTGDSGFSTPSEWSNSCIGHIHLSKDYGRTFKILPPAFTIVDYGAMDVQLDSNNNIYVMYYDWPNMHLVKYVPEETDYYNGLWKEIDIWNLDEGLEVDDFRFWLYDKVDTGGKKTGEKGVIFAMNAYDATVYGADSVTWIDHTVYPFGNAKPYPWPYPPWDPNYETFNGVEGNYYQVNSFPIAVHNGINWNFFGEALQRDVRYVTPYTPLDGELGNARVICPFDGGEYFERFSHDWYSIEEYEPSDPLYDPYFRYKPVCDHFNDYSYRTSFTNKPVEFIEVYRSNPIFKNGFGNKVFDSGEVFKPWYVGYGDDERRIDAGTWVSQNMFLYYDKINPKYWIANGYFCLENGPLTTHTPSELTSLQATGEKSALLISADSGSTWKVVGTPTIHLNELWLEQISYIYDGIIAHCITSGQSSPFVADGNRKVINVGLIAVNDGDISVKWDTVFESIDDFSAYPKSRPDFIRYSSTIRVVRKLESKKEEV
jgi:hypothetical protein